MQFSAEAIEDESVERAPDGASGAPRVYRQADGPAVAAGYVCDADAGQLVAEVLGERNFPAHVQDGGIAAAIANVSAGISPRLMIVDLSESTHPMAEIDALAEVCEPGMTVVALGTTNDVRLFRALLDAGVTDYLVKPLDRDALDRAVSDAVMTVQAGPDGEVAGHVTVMIGARGGAGATSVVVNTAWALAHERKQRVAILDLDLQFGAVALALDVEPGRGLREALENPDRIDSLFIASAAVSASENLYVLGAEEPLDQVWLPDPEALDLLLTELRQNFDCVLIDLPRSVASTHGAILRAASEIVIVTDRSLIGMRDTMRLGAMVKSVAPEVEPLFVSNRVGADPKAEIPLRDFEKGAEVKVELSVPEDPKAMRMAWHSGRPVATSGKRGKLVAAFSQLAKRVGPAIDEDGKEDTSLLRKLLKK